MGNKKHEPFRLELVLVVLLTSVLIFASIAEDVIHHKGFSILDPILGFRIITDTSQKGDQIFTLNTFWGNALVISVGTALLGLWLLKRKRLDQVIILNAVVGGAPLLNLILKQLFARPRPVYPQVISNRTWF